MTGAVAEVVRQIVSVPVVVWLSFVIIRLMVRVSVTDVVGLEVIVAAHPGKLAGYTVDVLLAEFALSYASEELAYQDSEVVIVVATLFHIEQDGLRQR